MFDLIEKRPATCRSNCPQTFELAPELGFGWSLIGLAPRVPVREPNGRWEERLVVRKLIVATPNLDHFVTRRHPLTLRRNGGQKVVSSVTSPARIGSQDPELPLFPPATPKLRREPRA
jgi:hypothetical protein